MTEAIQVFDGIDAEIVGNSTSETSYDPAPLSELIRARSYSRRKSDNSLENWNETTDRCLYSEHSGLSFLGKFTEEEIELVDRMQRSRKAFGSARWLWVGGTPWISKPESYPGAFNCSAWEITDWDSFGIMMDLAMTGCGTGANVELRCIEQLPEITTKLNVLLHGEPGDGDPSDREEETLCWGDDEEVWIVVGDSRQGWVKAYQLLLEFASSRAGGELDVHVDLTGVRGAGELLKGFGGISNPIALSKMFERVAKVTNHAIGRKLNSLEVCQVIGEAAAAVVAGSIRRCLPEDALVHTSEGLVPIKNVQVGDLVQTPLGFRAVVNKFDQGFQDVYEIETNATAPRATLSHQQAVLAGAKGEITWKRLSDLQPGDRLMHNIQVLPGTITHLPADFTSVRPFQSRNCKPVCIPELTPIVAWLIGFTHGNGHVSLGRNKHGKPYGSVSWTSNSLYLELLPKIRAKLDAALALFGVAAVHSSIKGENTAKTACCSIRLAEYFYEYIKQPSTTLEVPSFILQGTVDIRAAYLAGLMDSDGAINNRPPHLVTTVYNSFVKQVGAVLSSLGIAGRITITVPSEERWQTKYNLTLPALKSRYNSLIAPHSAKDALREGLKMYGFTIPGTVMREACTWSGMRQMGFNGAHSTDSSYERYVAESEIDLDIPVTVKSLGSYDHVQTYDIEVEEAHCFYCDGYLTHNSAGMRVGSSDDEVFTVSKDDLWQQDEEGNWKIDPERDSLRSANHTRAFHKKPTLEQCSEAVTKQFYSGEGAIQWSGEAVARANADLLDTPLKKQSFLKLYDKDGVEAARDYLSSLGSMDERELENRIRRYSTNPCVRGDMRLLTTDGFQRFDELAGTEPYIVNPDGETVKSRVWLSGHKEIIELKLANKRSIFCTPDHVWQTNEGELQASEVKGKRLVPFLQKPEYGHEFIVYGFIQGDGLLARLKSEEHLGIDVGIGCNDHDMIDLLDSANYDYKWNGDRVIYLQDVKDRLIELGFVAEILPNRTLPSTYKDWSLVEKSAFLNGLYSANGSVIKTCGRVTLKTTCRELADAVAESLGKDFGIEGYVTTNPTKPVEFSNGVYQCKESYDVNIQRYDSRLTFFNSINFSINYKTEKLALSLTEGSPKVTSIAPAGFSDVYDFTEPLTHWGVVEGFIAHNCHEIIGTNFACNLGEVHLNIIDPFDLKEQHEAFRASSLQASALLQRGFHTDRLEYARSIDPIVGVSATGFFVFFTRLFGSDYVRWWASDRASRWNGVSSDSDRMEQVKKLIFDSDETVYDSSLTLGQLYKSVEAWFLKLWKNVVFTTVWEYCDRHNLRKPNRCTTVKPSGSMSLLTGVDCNGLHPPFAPYFIRRMTFSKDDPVALAAIDYGYNVVPSQNDKDEDGNLLNDPFSDRCTEWLVEVPVKNQITHYFPEVADVDFRKFSALAQFDFYMNVQQSYITHTGSVTISLGQDEIQPLAQRIYDAIQANEGYIGAALLARYDSPYPRLPFEVVSEEQYNVLIKEVLERRKSDDFNALINKHLQGVVEAGPQDSACDSGACELRVAEKR